MQLQISQDSNPPTHHQASLLQPKVSMSVQSSDIILPSEQQSGEYTSKNKRSISERDGTKYCWTLTRKTPASIISDALSIFCAVKISKKKPLKRATPRKRSTFAKRKNHVYIFACLGIPFKARCTLLITPLYGIEPSHPCFFVFLPPFSVYS
jgi:hypothetical protein